jgi:DNA adenine methylase
MARHRTPLRYPGGKQKLAPFFRELIEHNDLRGCEYAESFAGGAGVALDLLLSSWVSRIHLNDLSPVVAAFWQSVKESPAELCKRIMGASLTIEEWKKQREIVQSPSGKDTLDVGYAMLFLNRCNRSGILGGGVIGGLKQSGAWKMDARFSRRDLVERIELVATKSELISLTSIDGVEFLRAFAPAVKGARSLVYCDPPYFARSRRLYLDNLGPDDHSAIAAAIADSKASWVVSYDDVAAIRKLYESYRIIHYGCRYSASESTVGREILAFSPDLQLPLTSCIEAVSSGLRLESLRQQELMAAE